MVITNLLQFSQRSELRRWFEENHDKVKECWIVMYRSKKPGWSAIAYIDVVEEA